MLQKWNVSALLFSFVGLAFAIHLSSCEKNNRIDDGIPIYAPKPDIIHPPDTFKLMFPLNNATLTDAKVSFDTTSTWHIVRQNAFNAQFKVSTYQDTIAPITIGESTNLVFEKDVLYEFTAKNIYPAYQNLIVLFMKMPAK